MGIRDAVLEVIASERQALFLVMWENELALRAREIVAGAEGEDDCATLEKLMGINEMVVAVSQQLERLHGGLYVFSGPELWAYVQGRGGYGKRGADAFLTAQRALARLERVDREESR
ncbi:MAG: hypothetical protein QM705_07400 [Ancrocorticia sp.]